MRLLASTAFAAMFVAMPVFAACPPVSDRSAELALLFEEARNAPNEMGGRDASRKMWEIWTEAPDETAGSLLERGVVSLRVADYLSAIETFDRLTEYCPGWAEGYNQRAFAYFLSGNYEKARVDLMRTVEINPEHVGALSGLALTLTALGEEDAAQTWLKKALALNPWLSERSLLKEPPGEDL